MLKFNMDKSTRPVRNRKHSRSWTPVQNDSNRPIKRLFTPEIKRMLKEWLVRRRENPYPSREEKKSLAQKTGLTYIQICNWFANWRRKLKNAGKEPQKNTWGNLIKNYNTNARGNVEQFSICSNDSIWEDEERRNEYYERKMMAQNPENFSKPAYNTYTNNNNNNNRFEHIDYPHPQHDYEKVEQKIIYVNNSESKNVPTPNFTTEQCYQFARTLWIDSQVSSTTNNNNAVMQFKGLDDADMKQPFNYFSNPKYKNQIMEKYLRGLDETQENKSKCGLELSKWLESAANFTPDKNNYIEWESNRIRSKSDDINYQDQFLTESNIQSVHQKEELDAAEALTFLAGNCKSQWIK